MNKNELQDRIDEGEIHALAILQMVGKPKEHVEKTFSEFTSHLEKMQDGGFQVFKVKNNDIEPHPDSEEMFSTFAEVDVLAKDMLAMINFCFEAMPSSVEIQAPQKVNFSAHDMTDMLTEFVGRMHNVDMVAKQARQENKIMSKSLGIMIQNAILILLNLGPRDLEGICEVVGIKSEQGKVYVDRLVADGKVEQVDDKYKVVPQSE